MGVRFRNRRIELFLLIVLGSLLVACTPANAVSSTPVPGAQAQVQFSEAPEIVCSSATQIRSVLQVSSNVSNNGLAQWQLRDTDHAILGEGEWAVKDGPLLVAFPEGRPLPAGTYTIVLSENDVELAHHAFRVSERQPAITHGGVSLVPEQEPTHHLAAPLHHFYVHYTYEGGCLGAPYWITVLNPEGELICNQSSVLERMEGSAMTPCYLEEGRPFEAGTYEAEITLMGDVKERIAFEIAAASSTATPAPTVTPALSEIACEPLFAAAALTFEGEPFLTPRVFDWYTQAVYVGSHCQNLNPTTPWRSVWYHEGDLVREAEGQWSGPNQGVIWDSITGVEANPFLAPGVYTVTVEIDDVPPLTTTFSIFDYQPSDADVDE